jgi:cytoskeletal protein CcmA (bactofilin family)
MLNFSRNDRPADLPKDPKLAQRPAAPAVPPPAASPAVAPRIPASPPAAAADVPPPAAAPASENPGSRLSIGPNINLKGVEISNCDVLAIEGNVEATINSKVMEIAPPGRLNGTATIDVAEIHGDFTGELTVREKLVVHGTGRVTGTIRYGKLVVAEGGTINGELKQLESAARTTAPAAAPVAHTGSSAPRTPLSPQPH